MRENNWGKYSSETENSEIFISHTCNCFHYIIHCKKEKSIKNQFMKLKIKLTPYTAFKKNNQLSNPRVFHLYVNSYNTIREIGSCALVKLVPMKYRCHFVKYIIYYTTTCMHKKWKSLKKTANYWCDISRNRDFLKQQRDTLLLIQLSGSPCFVCRNRRFESSKIWPTIILFHVGVLI